MRVMTTKKSSTRTRNDSAELTVGLIYITSVTLNPVAQKAIIVRYTSEIKKSGSNHA